MLKRIIILGTSIMFFIASFFVANGIWQSFRFGFSAEIFKLDTAETVAIRVPNDLSKADVPADYDIFAVTVTIHNIGPVELNFPRAYFNIENQNGFRGLECTENEDTAIQSPALRKIMPPGTTTTRTYYFSLPSDSTSLTLHYNPNDILVSRNNSTEELCVEVQQ